MDTLYAKTFLILSAQLGVTWLSAVILIEMFRDHYRSKAAWVKGRTNADGHLDLDLDQHVVMPYFWALLGADILVFLLLLFYGQSNLLLGIPLFTIWSVLTGFELALCLVEGDENLGSTVIALTALITLAAGLIGSLSGIDFSFLRYGLNLSLALLIVYGLIRIFFSIPRAIQRVWAFFGVVVFTGYLLYDFNRLSQLSKHAESNTWHVAMNISIGIYLDIINLFLDLLDLLSK